MSEEWTFATLIAWINAKFEAITATLDERAKAITVAFANFEKRMDSTNEWRGAMGDLTKTMASQQELTAVKERLEKVEASLLTSGGRSAGVNQSWAILAAGIGTAVGLFGVGYALMN